MKSYYIHLADLGLLLATTYIVGLGVIAPLVREEVLTFIEQRKSDSSENTSSPDGAAMALLEVTYGEGGRMGFVYSLKGKKQSLGQYEHALSVLTATRPQDIRLRVDRRVPSGTLQDLIQDCARLNIRVWQVSPGR